MPLFLSCRAIGREPLPETSQDPPNEFILKFLREVRPHTLRRDLGVNMKAFAWGGGRRGRGFALGAYGSHSHRTACRETRHESQIACLCVRVSGLKIGTLKTK